MAFVNGKPITQTEFDHEWGDLPDATKARYEKEGGRQVFLKELVDHELLLQEARKQGLDQSDAIRDRVRRYKEAVEGRAAQRPDEDDGRAHKEELDKYYEEHAGELLTPLKVRVAQMLLPNYPAAKDLERRSTAAGIWQVRPTLFGRLQDKGERRRPRPLPGGLVIPEVDEVIDTLSPAWSAPHQDGGRLLSGSGHGAGLNHSGGSGQAGTAAAGTALS